MRNYSMINITDHLGNVRAVVNQDGMVVETNDYYAYGMLMDGGAKEVQPFKYCGKELDRMHGLNWYDHGARMSDPALGQWHVVDPLCEKFYDVSPYALCGNDPVNFVDLDGKDWYKDKDNSVQYNPSVHSGKDLGKNQTYLGATFKTKSASYRKDGSILFNRESEAYNRIWTQANQHYQTSKQRNGRESSGFILSNGKVLVLPEYKNTERSAEISEYGYKIEAGKISKGKETFSVIAQIHTHQDKTGDATPSTYANYGMYDGRVSEIMKIPVFVMGHDNNMYGILQNSKSNSVFNLNGPFKTVRSFLKTKTSFSSYIINNKWKL